MNPSELEKLVQNIVKEAQRLSVKHTGFGNLSVNYACVFTQSNDEFDALTKVTQGLGDVVQETKMGSVFHILPISTVAGDLRLLKIRRPDPDRPERGDADFTVSDYASLKQEKTDQPDWKLIERPNMEMLELSDPEFNVLAYYSHPPLLEVLGI